MKIEVGSKYRLNAAWHAHNKKIVEVIKKRKGVSPDFDGKMIYHIAINPSSSMTRIEDLDEEFLSEHFKAIDEGLTQGSLEDFLDDKGVENLKKLEEFGMKVSLWTDEEGSHYIKTELENKVDFVKVEDYEDDLDDIDDEGIEEGFAVKDDETEEAKSKEDHKGPGLPLPKMNQVSAGPPNPMLRDSESNEPTREA